MNRAVELNQLSPEEKLDNLSDGGLVQAESELLPTMQPAIRAGFHLKARGLLTDSQRVKLLAAGFVVVLAILSAGLALILFSHNQNSSLPPSTKLSAIRVSSPPESASTLHVNFNTVLDRGRELTATGQVLLQNQTNSKHAFDIQNADGNVLFNVDTTGKAITIGSPGNNVALTIAGNVKINGSIVLGNGDSIGPGGLVLNSLVVCTSAGCKPNTPTNTSSTDAVTLNGNSSSYFTNASNITTGTLNDNRLSTNVALLNANQAFAGANSFSNAANSYLGIGSGLTALNASNISTGALSDSRLSSNVALLGSNQTFSGNNTFTGGVTVNNTGGVTFGTDTDLYRSAVNTLQTDGSLVVGSGAGALAVNGSSGALQAAAAVGSDMAGSSLTLAAGQGTGMGNGGNVNIQVATPTVSVPNQNFIAGESTPTGVTINGSYIYWSNFGTNSIGRANLDGTGVNQSFITGANGPQGLAVDGSYIYWTSYWNGTIGRANLDGTGVNQSFISGGSRAYGVAVNSDYIYWANAGNGTIGRANLDGTGVNQSFITGASAPGGVAVNGNYIYWINYTSNTIGRANLDGTGVNQSFISGTNGPNQLTVDSSHLYWTNSDSTSIGRANLDGTGVNQSFITGASAPHGLAVSANYIYWANYSTNTIGRFAFGNAPNVLSTVATISGANGAATFQNATNSITAFQVQNAAGQSLLTADTSGMNITLNGANTGQIGAWNTNPNPLPQALFAQTSVTANGYVYVMGGSSGTTQSTVYYAKLNANGSVGTWSTNAYSLPQALVYASSVVANGYVYVIAGTNSGGYQSTVYYAKLNADGSTGAWQTNTNALPQALYTQTAVAANGYVYVIGGHSTSGDQSTVYYAKLNADGSVGTWNASTALPQTRTNSTSVVANGYVYVIGGQYGSNIQSTVYYAKLNGDGSVGSWQTASNSLPDTRRLAVSVVANGYVYVMGGYNGSYWTTVYYAKLNADGSVGSWNTSTNPLPQTISQASSVIANGYVYVIGGYHGSAQSVVYYTSTSRTQIAGSLDLVGISGQTLADGGSGGSLTAGNTTVVGQLQVSNQANFTRNVSIGGSLGIAGITSASQIQASGTIASLYGTANAQLSWNYQASTGLTMSGNEITDQTRLTDTQGDGRTAPDSSTGIWEGTTNLNPNGGFESNTSNWGTDAGDETISRDTSVSKFGAASMKIVTPGSTGAEGNRSSPITTTPGQTYTASAWVRAPAGASMYMAIVGPTIASTNFTGTGNWQYLSVTGTTSSSSQSVSITTCPGCTEAVTFWVDGVQLEQKSIATPYVETNGATASRNAARVQAPAANLDETQGWIAVRARMGWGSSAPPHGANAPIFFEWGDNQSSRLVLYFDPATSKFTAFRAASAYTIDAIATPSFSAGNIKTLIFAWTASQVSLSLDGSTFNTLSDSHIPVLAATMFDIGEGGTINPSQESDSNILWTAAGTGTLSNADATTLNNYGNTDPLLSQLTTLNSGAASPTMVWNGVNSNYNTTSGTAQSMLTLDDASLYRGAANTLQTNSNFLLQSTTNSTTAFQIQNASGVSLLTADTVNNQIVLGPASATPTILVLGTKNTAGDPATCTNGGIYYNSSSSQFRGCAGGTWISLNGPHFLGSYTEAQWAAGTKPTGMSTGDVAYFDGSAGAIRWQGLIQYEPNVDATYPWVPYTSTSWGSYNSPTGQWGPALYGPADLGGSVAWDMTGVFDFYGHYTNVNVNNSGQDSITYGLVPNANNTYTGAIGSCYMNNNGVDVPGGNNLDCPFTTNNYTITSGTTLYQVGQSGPTSNYGYGINGQWKTMPVKFK